MDIVSDGVAFKVRGELASGGSEPRASHFAVDICLCGGLDGLHDDLDLAVLAWRQIPEGPDVIGAGIGPGIGIYEYRPLVIFFPDDQVHGLQLIVSIGYGVGYLAAWGSGFGAVLDIFILQGLEAEDLISDLYIIDKGGRFRHFWVFIDRNIDPNDCLTFQPAP